MKGDNVQLEAYLHRTAGGVEVPAPHRERVDIALGEVRSSSLAFETHVSKELGELATASKVVVGYPSGRHAFDCYTVDIMNDDDGSGARLV